MMNDALRCIDDDKWYLPWEVDIPKEVMEEIDRVSEEKTKELEGPEKPETSSRRSRKEAEEKKKWGEKGVPAQRSRP